MMRRLNSRKGQSTLEYVIIWTAIIAAILAVMATFRGHINTIITQAGTKVETEATKITQLE